MGDKRSGLSGAVHDAIGEADPLLGEVESLDLFDGDPDAGSPVGGSRFAQGEGGSPVQRRDPAKGGRPKGSRNVTTKQMIDFITARYRHPLLGLADIAATPPDRLVELILPRDEAGKVKSYTVKIRDDGSPVEVPFSVSKDDLKWAFDFWKQCTMELAEYVATKQPRQIQTEDGLPPVFNVYLGGQSAAGMAPDSMSLGMPEYPMNSTVEDASYHEVPHDEVPQGDAPAADTTGSEPSGS